MGEPENIIIIEFFFVSLVTFAQKFRCSTHDQGNNLSYEYPPPQIFLSYLLWQEQNVNNTHLDQIITSELVYFSNIIHISV